MFTNALQQSDKVPLSSLYGALEGLSELGAEVIRIFIIPKLKLIGARIETYLQGSITSNIDKIASDHIKQLLIKVVAPVLKNVKNPPDFIEEYKQEYGYLGPALHGAVLKARTQPTPSTTTACNISSSLTNVSATITRTVSQPCQIIQQVGLLTLKCIYFFNIASNITVYQNKRLSFII